MRRMHFIGIGGTAMASLAAMVKRQGVAVTGSDLEIYSPMKEFLAAEDIKPFRGYSAEQISDEFDLVVIGNAISRGNVELEAVLNRRMQYASLPEVIRNEFLWKKRSLVIAGTHGKTTTAAMTAWLLTFGKIDPSMLIGGVASNFGSSYRLGSGTDFVIEGDEYDSAFFDKTAKFLKYLPNVAVIGNVEFDHADIYTDFEAVRTAFRRFVRLLPANGLLLLGADNPEALSLQQFAPCRVETFGLSSKADWCASQIVQSQDSTAFEVRRHGVPFMSTTLQLLGHYNVRNSLAAIAVASDTGLVPGTLNEGLRAFRGVRRRLEVRGTIKGITVYDDFAHHPTAVAETLTAVRGATSTGTIWAIFEPRSATSCRRVFQEEFVTALRRADEVLLAPVYRSSLPDSVRLNPEEVVDALASHGVHARYIPRLDDLVELLGQEAKNGDHLVIMSNGAFGGIHEKVLARLAERV